MGKEILEKETQVSNAPEIKLNFSTYQQSEMTEADITEENHLTWWTKSVDEFKEAFGLSELRSQITKKEKKPFLICMNSKGESADMFISASKTIKERAGTFDGGFNISLRCGPSVNKDTGEVELKNYFLAVALPKESISKSY